MIGRVVRKKKSLGEPAPETKRAGPLSPRVFSSYLKPERYLPTLQASNRSEVLQELVCGLKDIWPTSECDCIEHLLIAREDLGTTSLGKGLAVPHVRTALVTQLTVIIGRSKTGIAYRAPDGKRAHIFFLVLGPNEDPGNRYLSFLSSIVLIFRDRGMKRRLLKAKSFEELVAILEDTLTRE